jgi:mannose-6-phosphate isomerase
LPHNPPQPQALPPNVIEHWYLGGPALAAWRDLPARNERSPEEWIGSTTHRFGDPGQGPSRLADGTLLREAISADPIGWLGRDDGDEGDTGLLVKILDAGQRLPVHVHPTRDFAARHLACPYGKTEAWYVLQASPGASVWVGWRQDVSRAQVSELVRDQDVDQLLALLHRIPVNPGDGILVPGGTPHAIGAGVLLVEAQEPSDQSILLEHTNTTATESEIFLGLPRDVALESVTRARLADAHHLVHRGIWPGGAEPVSVLPPEADTYFRMHLLGGDGSATVEPGFAAVIVLEGTGQLRPEGRNGRLSALRRGQVWVVPASAGRWSVVGDVTVLVCRPGTSWPPLSVARA